MSSTQHNSPAAVGSPRRAAAGERSASPASFLQQLQESLKWLRLGMRVKRWLLVALAGIVILIAGVDLVFLMELSDLGDVVDRWLYQSFGRSLKEQGAGSFTYQVMIGVPTAVLGLLIFLYGLRNTLVSVTSAVIPSGDQPIADVIWRRRQLAQGPRVVVIGGGTGLGTLLRGLKEYTSNITAIVTVTDDGGSSGRLQREFKMLPPGDIRNCILALADAEPMMQRLFDHRFSQPDDSEGPDGSESSLQGHSFGNLLIAAMLHVTGDFEEAVHQTSRVLAIRGRVIPSTTRLVRLVARMHDGEVVEGESRITARQKQIDDIWLSEEVSPPEEALEAIRTADAIVIGPGSVYTSILPNFLVTGIAKALEQSSALKVYVCNVMTQRGETQGFSASDHVEAVLRHAGSRVMDYALVNVEEPGSAVLQRYASVGAEWVRPDLERIRAMGVRPVSASLIHETEVLRHDSGRLCSSLIQLINRKVRPVLWMLDLRD